MKNVLFTLKCIIAIIIANQSINQVQSQVQPDLIPCDSTYYYSIPEMVLSSQSANLILPDAVDNSNSQYFPRHDGGEELYMYDQNGQTSSCQSVATVFFTFTYEINRIRNVESNSQHTRYAPNFVWNHINNGNIHGYTSLEKPQYFLMESGGLSDWDFDGVAQLNALDYLRWPTGYDLYYNALQNKLESVYKIVINQDGSGLETLKHYLFDHNEGSNIGGVVTFGAKDYGVPMAELIEPSAFAGELVRYKMRNDTYWGHAVTIVGYNDDVMYDWGGSGTYENPLPDGEYSNTKDNNLDGIIDMSDWEIGALKVADNYGPEVDNEGFEWVLYCCLPTYINVHRNEFFVLQPSDIHHPEVVLKVKIEHEKRDDIILGCGYALTADQNTYIEPPKCFVGMNMCGGTYPMQGADINGNLINGPIEVLLDFSYYYSNVDFGKVFLYNVNSGTLPGTIHEYSLIDYRWDEVFELPYYQSNFPIGNPSAAGINYDLIPHENDISLDLNLTSDMVSRFNPTVSHNATLTIGEDVLIDMYNSEITINEGSNLIIQDNAIITAKTGLCKLTINGNVSIGSNVTFKAEGESQLQIYINNYMVDAVLSNCTFDNTSLNTFNRSNILSNCFFTNSSIHGNHGNFEISQCDFLGSYAHFLDDMPTLDERHVNITNNCSFEDVTVPIALEINSYPNFRIQNSSLINCNNAIFIYNSGFGRGDQLILNNNVSGNIYTGITAYRSYVDIIDNVIENNYIGIKSFDRSVMHLGGDYQTVTQIVKDNTSFEVYASEGSFPQYFHWNLIQDDDNLPGDPLVNYTGSASLFDVRNNCWGANFNPLTDLYPSGYIWNPIWYCFSGEGTEFYSETESMYLSATNEVDSGEYVSAKTEFKQIVSSDPTSIYAEASLKELYSIEAYAENNYMDLKNYYASDSIILNTPELDSLSDFLINFCEIKLENWPTAINWFENVIVNPDSFEDSVFAIIDLEYTYLLMENSGMKSSYCGVLSEYKPTSRNQFEADRDYLLSLLPGNPSEDALITNSNTATDGKLLQNIPNPFYRETQIPYEVINDTKVDIIIYNNVGQIVNSSNEGLKTKGIYYFAFNGNNLPEGIYYYTIFMNGKMICSKKMALLK